ncbi:trypsin-1-like [Contarinia nasturtii]|uniref:trypsin-1-like n=1 Tax=Contarinia nasturtii TaxID=265458 RepID=UPI0012D41D03|nr:trypsin-1-like [Contarinia nasturtii]
MIVGGHETIIEKHPWQVALLFRSKHSCGGSIISETFVLSAAHCFVSSRSLSDYQLRVGSSYHAKGGEIVKIKRVFIHKKYDTESYDYDFALIFLAKSLKFGNKIRPIALIRSNQKIWDGTKSIVTGWGLTKNPFAPNDKLRKASVPIVSQELCKKVYAGGITDRMICAGHLHGGIDACD